MKNWGGYFLKLISKKHKGVVEFSYGVHEILIRVNKKTRIESVLLELDTINIGNCSGINNDSFDYIIVDNGFILKVDIKSNKRTVKWIAY